MRGLVSLEVRLKSGLEHMLAANYQTHKRAQYAAVAAHNQIQFRGVWFWNWLRTPESFYSGTFHARPERKYPYV
jgi:hypothetical protein